MSEVLEYFRGDDLAASVWKSKYALDGEITPDDMHRRLAKEFAKIEDIYIKDELKRLIKCNNDISVYGCSRNHLTEEDIYELFKDFKYIVPQGSVMSQLGAKSIGSLSNCFVIGQPQDSYGGIFLKDQEMAQLMKRRGGVGLDLSTLRPKGASTSNAAKSSTGVVEFAKRYSNTTREVAQDGRRGALMLTLSVDHPDVLEFAKAKRNLSHITGANISIQVNDRFMEAVKYDTDYALRFPTDSHYYNGVENYQGSLGDLDNFEYNYLYEVDQGVYVKRIKARELWEEIVESAHMSAEPGIMFVDNHWNASPDGVYPEYKGVTTNPCGEIFMQPYDACRLLATNLYSFVKNPFTKNAEFDFDLFYRISYESMRLADDLVDLELNAIDRIIKKISKDPETGQVKMVELNLWNKIKSVAASSRRTGNGFTALGDTIAALSERYGSAKAISIVERIMETKKRAELDATIDMAVLRGPFGGWNPDIEFNINTHKGKITDISGNNAYYNMLVTKFPSQVERMIKNGRRNVSWSTVAPTGSVSLLTQTTSGIEPLFQPYYIRRRKIDSSDNNTRADFVDDNGDKWQEYTVLHPKFREWILARLPEGEKNLEDAFRKSPWFGSTANEVHWEDRLKVQRAVQKYTTHSISSTLNLPKEATVDDISNIYRKAWELGLKGVTVYREGSRDGVLINKDERELTLFNDNHAPKRPKRLKAIVIRFMNNKERWVGLIGIMDGKPYEIFTGLSEHLQIPGSVEYGEIVKERENGHKRYTFVYDGGESEDISRIFNRDFHNYAKLISGVLRHGMPLQYVIALVSGLTFNQDHINTWKVGVIRSLKKFIKSEEVKGFSCESCGSTDIIFEEGCLKCTACGSSKCG